MKVTTNRFGKLDVKKEELFHLKEGLMGFESLRDFFIVDPGDQTLILWFQSLDNPEVAFPVIEPKIFQPSYSLKLLPQEMQSLELKDNDYIVFCVLTIPRQVTEMSANLKAPIVINNKTRQGRQIVLQDSKLNIRYQIYNDLKQYIVNFTSNKKSTEENKAIPTVLAPNRPLKGTEI